MNKKSVGPLLFMLLVATGAVAQQAADEGLVHRRELVRRYMSATHLNDRMQSMTTALLPIIMEQNRKQYPNIPDKVSAAMKSAAEEAMSDFIPKVENRYADLMAQKFSADELERITTFYESPVGQKIIAKTGEMMSTVQPLMRELLPGLQADMLHRLCAKIDCSTLPKPAKT